MELGFLGSVLQVELPSGLDQQQSSDAQGLSNGKGNLNIRVSLNFQICLPSFH